MPILNIRDSRKNPFLWNNVTVIFEHTWHDNSIARSSKMEIIDTGPVEDGIGYEEFEDISLQEAIAWGTSHKNHWTMFIYDLGDGISNSKET